MNARGIKYNPGDRVVSTANWHRQKSGAVARSGRGVSVMVRWDGEDQDERIYVDGLRPETAEDISKREHTAAMREWRERRPRTEVARIDLDPRWGRDDEIGATASARTPAEMRQAADELRALADWFEKRPATPENP